jgi:hypothetical protein
MLGPQSPEEEVVFAEEAFRVDVFEPRQMLREKKCPRPSPTSAI